MNLLSVTQIHFGFSCWFIMNSLSFGRIHFEFNFGFANSLSISRKCQDFGTSRFVRLCSIRIVCYKNKKNRKIFTRKHHFKRPEMKTGTSTLSATKIENWWTGSSKLHFRSQPEVDIIRSMSIKYPLQNFIYVFICIRIDFDP